MNRILFISHTSKLGAGTSQSLLLMLKYLRTQHQVGVVLDRRSDELPKALREMGVPYQVLPNRVIRYLPSLVYLILRNNYNLVYGNNFSGRCKVALWAAKITGRPFIWHIRESLSSCSNTRFLSWADAIIANSQDTSARVKHFVPHKKVITILNGVDLDLFCINRILAREILLKTYNLPDDSVIILNVGNLCPRKNQLHTIHIAAKILQNYPKVYFIFLGNLQDISYVNTLNNRVSEYCMQDHVIFAGFQENVNTYYVGSDILLHTAEKEPQGRVILEAMAARLPVVAYKVGGIPEVVQEGKTGYLIPCGEIQSMYSSLKQLIDSPQLRIVLGESGFNLVKEEFTVEKTGQQINEVINSVLNG